MAVITLLTDFGTSDTYVAQMKGVLAAMAPQMGVIDLTHAIPPQDVLAGALHLDAAADAFADDTIHVAVVDPGVGGERRGIAVRCACGTLVGPDNGLFTAVLERYPAKAAVALEDRALFRHEISHTFHGRDIFTPVAAHLANGLHLTEFGPLIDDIALLDIPAPQQAADGSLTLRVLWVDHFGNLITNLREEALAAWLGKRPASSARVIPPTSKTAVPIGRTFSEVAAGEAVAYVGSSGRLEVAVRNGNASHALGIEAGATLRVICTRD